MSDATEHDEATRRKLKMGLVAVIAIAAVGFLFGIRTMPESELIDRPYAASSDGEQVSVPGQRYDELRLRRYGANSEVSSPMIAVAPSDATAPTEAAKNAALTARKQRRAYEGAPPVIPHEVDAMDSAACLACHGEGAVVGDLIAHPLSHEPYSQCVQCHAPTSNDVSTVHKPVANAFGGAGRVGRGSRAWQGAPPTIPHTLQMRSNCVGCHGPAGDPGLRTSHPERRSCQQCHVSGGQTRPRF